MKKVHFTENYLLNPHHPVTVFVIGAGGTGSQVITNLARMNMALRALGHPGLHVTVFDPDTVSTANIGRQLFSETELGLNKATALVTRINHFSGYSWSAEAKRYPDVRRKEEMETANLFITCTDNVRSRLALWKFLKGLSTLRDKIVQPSSQKYIPVPRMNVITEEVDYSQVREVDSGPSCSLAEALGKQDLFINSTLAHIGCNLLWKMFKEGKTAYRGAYVNLDSMKTTGIPV